MATRVRVTERGLAIVGGTGGVGTGGVGTGSAGAAAADPAAADEELDLFAGAMHYWRVPRASWAACLAAMVRLGFRIVETYVPWGVHQRDARGGYDFTSPQHDLGAFLELAAAHGLRAIVRPGPHINAELTYFGFPERIVRDQRMWARSAGGAPVHIPAPPRMFPVPSYASREFQRAVADWLRAVGDVVAPRLAPGGPVVAAQVDNELQMFFRVGAFDHDYHPEALAWWAEFAGGLPPPRAWDAADAPRCLRWVAFKDEYAARALSWIAAAMRAAGFEGIPLFHNFPPTEPETVHLPRAEHAIDGVVGTDFYHRRVDYTRLRRRALYLAGTARTLPFAPEVGLGGPLWLPPMTPSDQRNTIRGLLMAGVRAMSLFMVVERDRWYGAPLGSDGSERPEVAGFVRRLLAVVRETQWTALRARATVALVVSRAMTRVATASSLLDPVTPVVTDMLPGGAAPYARVAAARDHRAVERAWFGALSAARTPFVVVDEALPAARLAGYDTVVAPTGDLVDRALWRTLAAVAARGGKVILGPVRPTRDEFGAPLDEPDFPAVVAADVAALRAALPAPPVTYVAGEDSNVDCVRYGDGVLFVGTATETPSVARIVVPGTLVAEDLFSGKTLLSASDVLEVPLAPHQVRMFGLATRRVV